MNRGEEADINKLVENVNSLVIKCQNENIHLLNLVRSTKRRKFNRASSDWTLYSRAAGDNLHVNPNMNEKSQHHALDMSKEKERLSLLIKKANEDNFKLRESNVKLKQESKVQDQKIRDLKHKIILQEKNILKSESQKLVIEDLKRSLGNKTSEIRQLTKNLEDVKIILAKEQKKFKNFNERQKFDNKPKKIDTNINEILSRIEVLLNQIEEQIRRRKQGCLHNCSKKTASDQVQNLLSRLNNIKLELKKQQSELSMKLISGVRIAENNQHGHKTLILSSTGNTSNKKADSGVFSGKCSKFVSKSKSKDIMESSDDSKSIMESSGDSSTIVESNGNFTNRVESESAPNSMVKSSGNSNNRVESKSDPEDKIDSNRDSKSTMEIKGDSYNRPGAIKQQNLPSRLDNMKLKLKRQQNELSMKQISRARIAKSNQHSNKRFILSSAKNTHNKIANSDNDVLSDKSPNFEAKSDSNDIMEGSGDSNTIVESNSNFTDRVESNSNFTDRVESKSDSNSMVESSGDSSNRVESKSDSENKIENNRDSESTMESKDDCYNRDGVIKQQNLRSRLDNIKLKLKKQQKELPMKKLSGARIAKNNQHNNKIFILSSAENTHNKNANSDVFSDKSPNFEGKGDSNDRMESSGDPNTIVKSNSNFTNNVESRSCSNSIVEISGDSINRVESESDSENKIGNNCDSKSTVESKNDSYDTDGGIKQQNLPSWSDNIKLKLKKQQKELSMKQISGDKIARNDQHNKKIFILSSAEKTQNTNANSDVFSDKSPNFEGKGDSNDIMESSDDSKSIMESSGDSNTIVESNSNFTNRVESKSGSNSIVESCVDSSNRIESKSDSENMIENNHDSETTVESKDDCYNRNSAIKQQNLLNLLDNMKLKRKKQQDELSMKRISDARIVENNQQSNKTFILYSAENSYNKKTNSDIFTDFSDKSPNFERKSDPNRVLECSGDSNTKVESNSNLTNTVETKSGSKSIMESSGDCISIIESESDSEIKIENNRTVERKNNSYNRNGTINQNQYCTSKLVTKCIPISKLCHKRTKSV